MCRKCLDCLSKEDLEELLCNSDPELFVLDRECEIDKIKEYVQEEIDGNIR